MSAHEMLPEVQYELNPFGYCGVFMPKAVMEKLAKLTHRHLVEVREVLEAHKDQLTPAHWTMAMSEDKSKVVYTRFTIRGESPESRIKLFTPKQPERREVVYVVDDYKEADGIAKELLAELEGGAS